MNKWIAEFELEDGDKMPEHMDLTYKGIKLDFHCRPITECEDAISRQEVIETIKELNWRYNGHPGGEVYGAIIELPSVRPKVGHWISVHERLPEKNGNYLVTYESFDGTARIRYEDVDHYGPDWLHESKYKKVVAWMPLPKPYKAESEET